MSDPSPNLSKSLYIRRVINAPRERVFRAWTEPEALHQWFRPMGLTMTVVQFELHVGGTFQFDLTSPDGGQSTITGTYIEIVQPEKLVFDWASSATNDLDTRVTVQFIELDGSTEVILTHDRFASSAMIDEHQHGWVSVLDQLPGAV